MKSGRAHTGLVGQQARHLSNYSYAILYGSTSTCVSHFFLRRLPPSFLRAAAARLSSSIAQRVRYNPTANVAPSLLSPPASSLLRCAEIMRQRAQRWNPSEVSARWLPRRCRHHQARANGIVTTRHIICCNEDGDRCSSTALSVKSVDGEIDLRRGHHL